MCNLQCFTYCLQSRPNWQQDAPDLASAAALLYDLGKEFAVLRSDVERLTSSLSDSVHEATQLTLTHTRLYDSAVGVLQVSLFPLIPARLPMIISDGVGLASFALRTQPNFQLPESYGHRKLRRKQWQ